ncbi:MAG: hypothetical protein D6780_08435 [Candidatus Dadabacteria bacterium]|nr:MAG: hypothetical protein D6780_08435 [Candidatus Dadabacteria bacterium]
MKKGLKFLFLAIFIFVFNVYGEGDAFTGVSKSVSRKNLNLYGGRVEALAIASNGNLYAAVGAPNGIFCSSDGASSWSAPPAGSDFGNVIDLAVGSDPNTVYFIGGIKLYKTDDGCQTFSEIVPSSGVSNFDQSIAFAHNVLLVAFRDGTLYKSSDNGATLVNVTVSSSVSRILDIAPSPVSGEFYVLVSESGAVKIYKSSDSGDTWSAVTTDLSCNDCNKLGVSPSDSSVLVVTGIDKVYISTDSGATFKDVSPSGAANTAISFVGSRIYVGSLYTEDNGSTFTDLNSTVTSKDSSLWGPIVQDPSNSSILYIGSLRGVAKSEDSGSTFTDSVEGMVGVTVSSIAQSTDKDTVYLAATGGLAKSTDFTSGPTWTYPIDVTGSGDTPTAVFLPDPSTPNTVLVAVFNGIYRSTDGGSTFSAATISSSNFGGRDNVMAFAKTSDGTLYAAHLNSDNNTGGVLVSSDGGVSWSDFSLPNSAPANDIVAVGDTLLVGVGTENSSDSTSRGIYRWDGSSWTQLSGDFDGHLIQDLDVAKSDSNIVYAVSGDGTSAGVFKSTDGGATFSEVGSSDLPTDAWYRAVGIDPSDADVVYVASGRPAANGVIYKSSDGGNSWSKFADTLVDEVPKAMVIDGPLMGSATGLNSFEELKCIAKAKKKKRKVVVTVKRGGKVVSDLSSLGFSKAKVILKRKGGSKLKKKLKKKGRAVFKNLQSGTYKAICRWTDSEGSKVKVKSKKRAKL